MTLAASVWVLFTIRVQQCTAARFCTDEGSAPGARRLSPRGRRIRSSPSRHRTGPDRRDPRSPRSLPPARLTGCRRITHRSRHSAAYARPTASYCAPCRMARHPTPDQRDEPRALRDGGRRRGWSLERPSSAPEPIVRSRAPARLSAGETIEHQIGQADRCGYSMAAIGHRRTSRRCPPSPRRVRRDRAWQTNTRLLQLSTSRSGFTSSRTASMAPTSTAKARMPSVVERIIFGVVDRLVDHHGVVARIGLRRGHVGLAAGPEAVAGIGAGNGNLATHRRDTANPSTATAVNKPRESPKWCAGAAWDTPARRATSRRLKPRGPRSATSSAVATRKAARQVAVVIGVGHVRPGLPCRVSCAAPDHSIACSLDIGKIDLYSVILASCQAS